MTPKAYPVVTVVLMAVFLSTIIFININPAFAGTEKKTSSGLERISAIEHTEAQIKELEDALMITEAQKKLWSNLILVMRKNAKGIDVLRKNRAGKSKDMNAVERVKLHSQITEVRSNQMKTFLPPFEAFYGSMTDEQKMIIDDIFHFPNDHKGSPDQCGIFQGSRSSERFCGYIGSGADSGIF